MGADFVHGDDTIDYTPAADVTAGDVIVQSKLIGIAKVDIAANALGALAVEGVFDVPKAAGGGITFSAGDYVYWDAGAGEATNTANAGANLQMGKAELDAADADDTVRVMLTPEV
jgi:predicted RecA/RadA family phage recombinase